MKKTRLNSIFGFCVVVIVASFFVSCAPEAKEAGSVQEQSTANKSKSPFVIVAGRKEGEAMINNKSFKQIDAQWDRIDQARVYERTGNYELAEIEFKKAIEADPSDQGVPRRGLARIYEASGQYQKALDQINWLLERTSRQDVKDELLTRKQTLEKLLVAKTQNPNLTRHPPAADIPAAST